MSKIDETILICPTCGKNFPAAILLSDTKIMNGVVAFGVFDKVFCSEACGLLTKSMEERTGVWLPHNVK